VYREGLIDGRPGPVRLVHAVMVESTTPGAHVDQEVLIDAATGATVLALPTQHSEKSRCVYTPAYVNPTGNDELAVRREGQKPTFVPPLDNLYDFSGHSYDLFHDVFGRDSWDGQGHKMRTIYDATAICPNAYWDGTAKVTKYCPGFDIDDVVAHEWGHAYTQATHGLIYLNQPGALNESYSDIWGEVVDLTNGVDGIGGSDNAHPTPVGQRWVLGEDLMEAGEALGLRDMYNPESRNQPGKVSSASYFCGTGDNGGVHYNSAVPNHAFAMLVDGKTYNGHTVGAIGMTKAAHIYYQAMVAYQTPTSGFREHANALRASCADLLGVDLTPIPGDSVGQAVTASDCGQVEEAIFATEMGSPPRQCGGPLLSDGAPEACPGGSVLFSEDWESGASGWAFESSRLDVGFSVAGDLPEGRAGRAAFAPNTTGAAGAWSATSPLITRPADLDQLTLRFDHSMASDAGYDGGNVALSVDGGTFFTLGDEHYTYNGPNATLSSGSPLAGQPAFTGTDTGLLTGQWGTSVIDLSQVVPAGSTFQLRFQFGQDRIDRVHGWYIDDVAVLSCPATAGPTLAVEDDEDIDTDGSYTLTWERPAGATGPDVVEHAAVSAPLFAEDASGDLSQWDLSTEGAGAFDWRIAPAKPGWASAVLFAQGNEATTGTSSILTSKNKISVPAAGDTTLSFSEWSYNHAGDKTVVEVSEDGSAWSQVFLRSTPYELAGDVGFATQPLIARTADLSSFAGKSVHLRFRFTQGPELYVDVTRYGWWVDDIAVTNHVWSTLATVSGTSHAVSGATDGTHMYRVSTRYGTRPSETSDVVSVETRRA
jgi:hypothetical protein